MIPHQMASPHIFQRRRRIGYRLAIVILLAIPFLSACTGGITRAYSGPDQPPERIALLRHQTGFAKPSVYFVRIDDQPISERKFRYGEIELLPGKHEAEFGFEAAIGGEDPLGLTYSTKTVKVVFEAEAGHEYEARAETTDSFWMALFGRRKWIGIIVDLSDDTVVLADSPFTIEVQPTPLIVPSSGKR